MIRYVYLFRSGGAIVKHGAPSSAEKHAVSAGDLFVVKISPDSLEYLSAGGMWGVVPEEKLPVPVSEAPPMTGEKSDVAQAPAEEAAEAPREASAAESPSESASETESSGGSPSMAGDEGSPASTPFNAIYETPQGN